MSEFGEREKAEFARANPIRSRLALLGGNVLTAIVLALGADQGPANAANLLADTPTPTTTPSKTPDVLKTQIAAKQTEIADLEKQQANRKRLAELQATAAALQTPATRTPVPTAPLSSADATATAEAIRLKALGEKQAQIKATATHEAALTAISEAKAVATANATANAKQATAIAISERRRERDQGGGSPGILGVLLGGVLGVAGVSVSIRERTRIGLLIRRVPGGGRILAFIKGAINLND